jgi:protein gp37
VGDKTGIEWADATWNPVTGCTKVSQGCRHCYALRDWARLSANPKSVYYGRAFTDVQCHEERLEIPLGWSKPRRIFVNSMSDLFHAAVPDAFILRVLEVMRRAPEHTFQVLTKRGDRMFAFFDKLGEPVPTNCHLGVSVEDQLTWEERAPWLLAIRAAIRFVSFEPLLGPIDARGTHVRMASIPARDWPLAGIQWAIVGGESGPQARPTHPDWIRSLRDQCELAGVPFFFKQWGEWGPGEANNGPPLRTERVASWWGNSWTFGTLTPKQSSETHTDDAPHVYRLGRRATGRMLDGRIHDARPGETG